MLEKLNYTILCDLKNSLQKAATKLTGYVEVSGPEYFSIFKNQTDVAFLNYP
jgi:hypothetical protein